MDGEEDLSQYSKEVAKGSFWGLTGNIVFKFVSFFYAILIARMASQDDIGLFFLTMSIVGLLNIFSDVGLPMSLVRYVPYYEGRNEKAKIRDILKLNYFVVTIVSIIVMLVLWWASDIIGNVYNNPVLPEAIRFLSAYLVIHGFYKIGISYLQGRADIKSMQFITNTENLSKLVFTFILFSVYGPSFYTLAAGFLLSFVFAVLVSLPSLMKNMRDLPSKAEGITKQELVKEIAPLGFMLTLITSFNVVLHSTDKALLGYLVPPSQATEIVAIYTMATTVAVVLFVFPQAIGSIFFPLVSRLTGEGKMDQVRAVSETAQRWSLFITIPVAMVLLSFSGDMLSILYGESYRPGAMALSIFATGILISSIGMVLYWVLAALRLVMIEMKIMLLVAFINIVFNILFIPYWGMNGAALASTISMIVNLALLLYFSKKIFEFKLPFEIYKILIAGIAAFALLLFLQPVLSSLLSYLPEFEETGLMIYIPKVIYLGYLTILTAISVLFFTVSSFVLKCFKKEDISLMKKIMLKAKTPRFIVDWMERIASHGVSTS